MLHKTSEMNKKWKRTAAGSLALLLCAGSLPLQALAGSYTVGNGDQMYNSWNQANASSDTSNSFYMDNNIDMSGYTLNVQEGNNYYIGSVSGENNTISNVDFTQGDSKGGDVTINANVSGTNTVLEVEGSNVDVTVNKNVTQTGAKIQEYPAVNVTGADVTIKGNVTVKSDAVTASDGAEVTINGSVTSTDGMGVHAYNDAEVTVKGNVTAEDLAVDAYNADVTVNGSVTSEEDRGILSRNESTVTVKKNVTSEDTAVVTYTDSTVTVMGNVNRTGDGGAADPIDFVIDAASDSNVTVNGNVTSADGGLHVIDANVVVKGDVTAEGQTVLINDASVSIGDDFISEKNSSTIGTHSGVFVTDSELVVTDDMQTPLLNASDDSEVFIGGDVKAKMVTVGNGDPIDPSDTDDTTTLRTGDIYWNKNSYNSFDGLYANGHSNTTVYGSVYGEVKAADTATVNVYGTTGYKQVEDDGFVQDQLRNEKKNDDQYKFRPGDTSEATELIGLCRGYIAGSPLHNQMSQLLNSMVDINKFAVKEMDSLSGILSVGLKAPDVLISKHLTISGAQETIIKSCNKKSQNNYEIAETVNAYEIEMYKANLAAALKDIGSETGLILDETDTKMLAKNVTVLHAAINGGTTLLPAEQQKKVNAWLADRKLDIEEAMDYLVMVGEYKKDEPALLDAGRELLDLLEFSEELKTSNKTLKVLLELPEFVDYWRTNYSNQVAVLDNMLTHMEMNPNQLLAAASLRAEYSNKILGTATKVAEKAGKSAANMMKELLSKPMQAIVILTDAATKVTGVSSKGEALQNCAAMINMLPEMYNALEEAIIRVRDGDSSKEAVQLVKTSYVLFRETLENMALNASHLDKATAKEYQDLCAELNGLDFGEKMW